MAEGCPFVLIEGVTLHYKYMPNQTLKAFSRNQDFLTVAHSLYLILHFLQRKVTNTFFKLFGKLFLLIEKNSQKISRRYFC